MGRCAASVGSIDANLILDCAIARVDKPRAKQIAGEFLEGLCVGDFRKFPEFGSPYECPYPEGDHRQNPVYMTSVTCPLAAFDRLGSLG